MHAAYRGQRDAELADEVGRAWARHRWHSRDARAPWPDFEGDQVDRAKRVTAWLALPADETRRGELAKRCHDSAGFEWEALQSSIPNIRDAPYRPPSGAGDVYALPGNEHILIVFGALPRAEPDLERQLDAVVRRLERGSQQTRCSGCTSLALCNYHAACAEHRDAAIAAEVGERWAQFAWQTSWHIVQWPRFEGRTAELAAALVAWLSVRGDDARVRTLAEICCWRAARTWEGIRAAAMGRFQLALTTVRSTFPMPSAEHIVLKFKPRLPRQ